MMDKVEWTISVPIFRNSLILKQLGLALGIPFGIIVMVITLGSKRDIYTLYALSLIGLLLFLTWLLIMVVYRGKYDVEYLLDNRGAFCRTQKKQAKANRRINGLTVALGLLSGTPSASGAGMLAQLRQDEFLKWNCVTSVKYKPRQNVIILRGGWTENITLFCSKENYAQVAQLVMMKTSCRTLTKTGI